MYLGERSATDPLASPLSLDLRGLPPIRIHVGDDEVLLDDARRFAERAVAAGVDTKLEIWQGLLHVFPSAVGTFEAADIALDEIAAFLKD
jgi:epsilon-lactone hydrolase